MSHIDRKLREKDAIRSSILAAARKIAVSEGWHAVTIRKIADAIEYTPPIVYEHFENKEGLIRELILGGFHTLFQEFEIARAKESDPKKQLMQLSLIQWEFAFNNTELYQLMFSLERPQPNEESLEAMYKIKDTFMKISGKNEDEVMELIFNWVCLLSGTISTMMRLEGHDSPHKKITDPLKLYKSFIDRFINSIS